MEKSAGIILFRIRREKREFLIIKYHLDKEYWGLVKGHIELGEKEEETILRETEEETQLKKIRVISGFNGKSNYFYKRDGKISYKEVVWYLGEVLDEEDGTVSHEHEELKWVSYDEAVKLLKYKKDKGVLIKAEERLNLEVTS